LARVIASSNALILTKCPSAVVLAVLASANNFSAALVAT
jgi:hypothetical protein